MKKTVKIILAVTIPLIVTASVAGILVNHFYFNDQTNELDQAIIDFMTEYNVPGVAVSAITNEEIVWMKSYGYSNIEENTMTTIDTLFMLGSISKTVTGTAFMQLVENGSISLDSDINNYLPFIIKHPIYPNTTITPRMY